MLRIKQDIVVEIHNTKEINLPPLEKDDLQDIHLKKRVSSVSG